MYSKMKAFEKENIQAVTVRYAPTSSQFWIYFIGPKPDNLYVLRSEQKRKEGDIHLRIDAISKCTIV